MTLTMQPNKHNALVRPARVVKFEVTIRSLLAIVLVIATAWCLWKLLPVLLVLIAALMLVVALDPLVCALETRKVRRTYGIGIVFIGVVGTAGLVLFLTLPPLFAQVNSVVEHEPEIRARVVGYLERSPLTTALANGLREVRYDDLLSSSKSMVLSVTARALQILTYTVATVFLAVYIMVDRDRLRGALFAVVPRRHHIRFSRVLINLALIVGGYIRGQIITCGLMTGFILSLLLVFRVPNALALAVFGGLMDVLPYIGAFLTTAPMVAAAYAVSPAVAVFVFVIMCAYQEFESRILLPVVYGRALRLPSSVVLFALIVGGTLGGIVGALLALPIAAAVLMLIEELRVELPGATEQPADVVVRQKDEQEEREYARRTENQPVVAASAIAVEITRERKSEEIEAAEKKVEKGESVAENKSDEVIAVTPSPPR
ncbi:MAG: AI-2E family transporter [Steroidobacteraceae bacterium]